MELTTERLVLRQWRDTDREPYAALNADPDVMEHYPATMTREQSDGHVDRTMKHIAEHGFGMWAVERREDGRFIGFVGLQWVPFEEHFTPSVEVGWRLARDTWGHGYATEGARLATRYAFDVLGRAELLAMTQAGNTRSMAVMHRLGMTHNPADNFVYPPAGRPGSEPFVLYRLPRAAFTG